MVIRVCGRHRWVMAFFDVLFLLLVTGVAQLLYGELKPTSAAIVTAAVLTWAIIYPRKRLNLKYFSFAFEVFLGLMIFNLGYGLLFAFSSGFIIVTKILCVWLISVVIFRYCLLTTFADRASYISFSQLPAFFYHQSKFQVKTDLSNEVNVILRNYDGIIFDPNLSYSGEIKKLFSIANIMGYPLISLHDLEEEYWGRISVATLNDMFFLNLQKGSVYSAFKRVFDVVLVIAILPAVLPIGLLVALLIFISMGWPVIFSQNRFGRNGKKFKIYKFRTMVNNADTHETSFNDVRITPLGRVLRKTRLDELPQLWNVLKGEMSLIGPRPEWVLTANEFNQEIPGYHLRHIIRPGITGWAQVKQGHTTGINGNLTKQQYDLFYVKSYSPMIDIKILFETLKVITLGHGAK